MPATVADLEYSPSLNGFVAFGTVGSATETIEPTALDALYVRATTNFTLPDGLRGESLTIGGGDPGAVPVVTIGAGTVFTPDILVTTGGSLQLGPELSAADPSNLAALTGTITVRPDALGVSITAGLFNGPVVIGGPVEVQGYANFIAPLEISSPAHIASLPGSQITYTAGLSASALQSILAAPDFAGNLVFSGTLDNSGGTLDISAISSVSFSNAVISGGTLAIKSDDVVSATTISDVTLAGTLATAAGDFNVALGTISGGALVVGGSFGFGDFSVIAGTDITLGANARIYDVNASEITFAADTAIHASDAALFAFAATGAVVRIDGTLDLSASVSPYTVEIQSDLGSLAFGALAEISIGANATFKINSALFNSGTIPVIGGTLELAHAGGSLGTLRFAGSDAALRMNAIGQTATLLDFQDGDHVVFPAASTSNAHVVLDGNTVDVFSGNDRLAGRFILNRSDGGGYSAQNFTFGLSGSSLSMATSGIAVTACYAAGTRIETASGDHPIEALSLGDPVRTIQGALVPITWIGHRTLELGRHPRPHDVQPIRVSAHAFGTNLPRRDLVLSPDHAIFVEGALVPVRYLLNGATIAQERRRTVTYYHLELPRHDVVFAEGLPAETYLDTGNRAAFANGGLPLILHPDFALREWQSRGFAPLLTNGDTLALIRHTLLVQAATLGHHRTTEPDFRLTRSPAGLTLLSRTGVPAHMDPSSNDHRPLGLAVTSLVADGRRLELDDPRLTAGWHAPEPGLRWTDGAAHIALPPSTTLAVEYLVPGPTYWLRPSAIRQAQAEG
jgi:hypothetical protein